MFVGYFMKEKNLLYFMEGKDSQIGPFGLEPISKRDQKFRRPTENALEM
jgi:hypothetical protein